MAVYAMVPHQGPNFTIEQIRSAHAKVKSGADFPNYIQELKILGVLRYEHFVTDGRIIYVGLQNYTISAEAKWENRMITKLSDNEQLKSILKIHQAGGTDYLTFCKQALETGVEKWVVNLNEMTCTYYDQNEKNMLTERINIP